MQSDGDVITGFVMGIILGELKTYPMTDKEAKEFLVLLEEHRKKVTSSKEAAREFLDSLGLLTPKGKFKRKYLVPRNVRR